MSNEKLKVVIELLELTLQDDIQPGSADIIVESVIKLLEAEKNVK